MTTQQLLVPSNATLKRNVMDYSLIVVGSFLQALSYVLFLAPYKIVPGGVYGISIVIHYVTKDLFPFFPDGLPMRSDGCDGALLQYPVDDSGDEKDRIVFRPEDDRYFLADLYIYRLIILFPYRSIGGERCLYRRLLRWSYFRLGRYLYFPGAKYECRYGCIGTCDR